MQNWAYSTSEQGLWVHLYGGNTISVAVAGEVLQLTQVTDYPWDDTVTMKINQAPSTAFGLFLRIPAWSKTAEVSLNGQTINVRPGSYYEIHRNWQTNDVVNFLLDMDPRLVSAHPRVEEIRNQTAVMRGPIVYCLESVDLADGVDISDVFIPRNIKLKAKYASKVLGGVTLLRGKLRVVQQDAEGDLYHPLETMQGKKINARFIPYFAWNNRG